MIAADIVSSGRYKTPLEQVLNVRPDTVLYFSRFLHCSLHDLIYLRFHYTLHIRDERLCPNCLGHKPTVPSMFEPSDHQHGRILPPHMFTCKVERGPVGVVGAPAFEDR
jgi:hypothetical protein